ncbi:hypothetical protein ACFL27_28175 [candidate division CSSED10-310 bacterium]|uniref:Two component regulator propeller n=1 Tax=candidate division CSSED10-310 bacterium TaxID=2855610 RepID=A0ABV6Z6K5_UNCC1
MILDNLLFFLFLLLTLAPVSSAQIQPSATHSVKEQILNHPASIYKDPNFALTVTVDEASQIIYWGGFVGLIRYDMKHHKYKIFNHNHGLPSNTINALYLDKINELLFIGTNCGLCQFDLATAEIKKIPLSDDQTANIITAFACDNHNRLYIGTNHGLFRFQNGHIEPQFDTHEFGVRRVQGLFFSALTGLWVAKENVLSRYHQGSWQIFLKEAINENQIVGLISNNLTAVCGDIKGGVWIGTTLGLNYYYHGHWKTYLQRDNYFHQGAHVPSDYIYTLTVDEKNRLWIGYGVLGLGACCFQEGQWRVFPSGDDLSSGYVYYIHPGRKGTVWFATAAGINSLSDEGWAVFRIPGISPDF